MCKAVSPLILLGVYRHSPQTDPLFPKIEQLSFPVKKLCLHLIQRLFSIASGPPEHRMLDTDPVILFFCALFILCGKYLPVRSGYRNDDAILIFFFSKQFKGNIEI